MNAPEKIYYNPSFQDYWKEERESAEDVEYIHKDIVDDMLKTAEDHSYFAGQETFREELLEWAKEGLRRLEDTGKAPQEAKIVFEELIKLLQSLLV